MTKDCKIDISSCLPAVRFSMCATTTFLSPAFNSARIHHVRQELDTRGSVFPSLGSARYPIDGRSSRRSVYDRLSGPAARRCSHFSGTILRPNETGVWGARKNERGGGCRQISTAGEMMCAQAPSGTREFPSLRQRKGARSLPASLGWFCATTCARKARAFPVEEEQ